MAIFPRYNPTMLDVHPPHEAAHTWKDFFIHIATIVVGLLIAVGLEQTVEYIHHRREVAETRALLREEREQNRKNFAINTAAYRVQLEAVANDMLVLHALRQHPATPEEELPGILTYPGTADRSYESAWKSAVANGVTQWMDRKEVADLSHLYTELEMVDSEETALDHSGLEAYHYSLDDPNLSHLKPTQIEQQIKLTEVFAEKNASFGWTLYGVHEDFPDFPAGPDMKLPDTDRSPQDLARLAPAIKRKDDRLAAAIRGYFDAKKAAEVK